MKTKTTIWVKKCLGYQVIDPDIIINNWENFDTIIPKVLAFYGFKTDRCCSFTHVETLKIKGMAASFSATFGYLEVVINNRNFIFFRDQFTEDEEDDLAEMLKLLGERGKIDNDYNNIAWQ